MTEVYFSKTWSILGYHDTLNHLLLFNCSYNVNDLLITSQFYLELLKGWSEFREENVVANDWHYII